MVALADFMREVVSVETPLWQLRVPRRHYPVHLNELLRQSGIARREKPVDVRGTFHVRSFVRLFIVQGSRHRGTTTTIENILLKESDCQPGAGIMIMMRILIADNRTLVRQGFRALLKSYGDFTACCEASDGETAVQQALEFKPDVAVLGITVEEPNGLHALREIQENIPDLPLVILYGNEPTGLVETTKALRIKAYVSTSASGKELIEVVERVAKGQTRSEVVSQELSGNPDQRGMSGLRALSLPQIRSEEDNS